MVKDPSWSRDDARSEPVRGKCLWCKHEADREDRERVGSEYLCHTCLGDAREFKRYTFVDILIGDGLEPSVVRAYKRHWNLVQQELAEKYIDDPELFELPERITNAEEYQERGAPEVPEPTDGERDGSS